MPKSERTPGQIELIPPPPAVRQQLGECLRRERLLRRLLKLAEEHDREQRQQAGEGAHHA